MRTGAVQVADPRAERRLVLGDQELVALLADRRAGAFEALVETYKDRLYGLAYRVTGSPEDAEEAVQDALVRAHRALFGRYSEVRIRELALRPWLFAVTVNAARNRLRGRRMTSSLGAPGPDGMVREVVAGGLSPPAAAENRELAQTLEQAIGALPLRYRAAVVVRLVEGLSYDEAAETLGRPVGTVKSDVHRGLRLLRQRLGSLLE